MSTLGALISNFMRKNVINVDVFILEATYIFDE